MKNGQEVLVNDLIDRGVSLRKEGQIAEAIKIYEQAVEMPDAPVTAFFNLGNALFDQGKWLEAQKQFTEALTRDNEFEPALLQLARCAVNVGDPMKAREYFAAVLRVNHENYSAWLDSGHVCRQQGAFEQMVICYRRAVEVAPNRWQAKLALARALEELGHFDGAAMAYHQAVVTAGVEQSTNTTGITGLLRAVHWRMAKYRLERGDAPRALEAMRQALLVTRLDNLPAEDNERAELQIDLGEILMRLGMTDEAHRAFERASVATSEPTLIRLAEVSFRFNLWQEAQAVLQRNVELYPESALAYWNLAHSYAESWQMDEALEQLEKAEKLAPQPGAKSMRASVAGRRGDADTALKLYRELAEQEAGYSSMRSSAAMSALYSDKLTAQEIADMHRELFEPLGEGARTVASFKNELKTDRRLKIGLVSADFHHQHPVNIFMQPVLANHNVEKFNLTVYFTGVSYDDQTQLAKQRVANWVECSSWNEVQLATRIEADEIDILLDLAGHTSMQRMSLFAKRAAPVQATFLGYPGSTGVPNIDWIIADEIVAPKGSEKLFTEKVMRLPNTVFCFAPEIDYPFPDYTKEETKRPITFGSFNNIPKLTPHTIKLWASILREVPDSLLILKAPSFKDEGAITIFTQRFADEGIKADRLEFRGPVGLTDMMAEYADVDIALDPVPYNGGTTSLQAMWMGVPVVVKMGNNFVSRMGASFMSAAGLKSWVAKDDAEYIKIAVRMAKDRQSLLTLKQGLRDRMLKSKAWDIKQYTQDFESALEQMWAQFCASKVLVEKSKK